MIAFAWVAQKNNYDCSHQLLFLKVGKYALLCLHNGYSNSSTQGVTKKLTQQYVGPLRVLEKVRRLAYHLDDSLNWRIHPVFLVTQLEPALPPSQDPFQRP